VTATISLTEPISSYAYTSAGKVTVSAATAAWQQNPSDEIAVEVHLASEPRRQELFRRLNLAPGGTGALVRMREQLLEAMDPGVERTPESQYCVFRSGRERFCLPVLDVEEVLEWPLVTKLPLSPAYVLGIFNLRGAIVPLIDIALTEGRRAGLLPKHVVVASLRGDGNHDDIRLGIAADEVVGTYSVKEAEDLIQQAPENVPHCVGMLRHDDRLALVIDLRRLLEVYPGPGI